MGVGALPHNTEQQVERSDHVVVLGIDRLFQPLHRIGCRGLLRIVNDRIGLMIVQYPVNRFVVLQVADLEFDLAAGFLFPSSNALVKGRYVE